MEDSIPWSKLDFKGERGLGVGEDDNNKMYKNKVDFFWDALALIICLSRKGLWGRGGN
jgi:hypothetical protein